MSFSLGSRYSLAPHKEALSGVIGSGFLPSSGRLPEGSSPKTDIRPGSTAKVRFARYTSFGFLHIIPTRPIDGWNGDSNLPTKTFRQTSGADEVQ